MELWEAGGEGSLEALEGGRRRVKGCVASTKVWYLTKEGYLHFAIFLCPISQAAGVGEKEPPRRDGGIQPEMSRLDGRRIIWHLL